MYVEDTHQQHIFTEHITPFLSPPIPVPLPFWSSPPLLPPSLPVSGMALTIKDLGDVHSAVFEACTKWYDIGLKLNVPVDTQDSIRIDSQFHNHGEKLREALKLWLKTDTEPTWQDIVDVLKSRVVGEPRLASKIEAKHCSTPEARGRRCLKCSNHSQLEVQCYYSRHYTGHHLGGGGRRGAGFRPPPPPRNLRVVMY